MLTAKELGRKILQILFYISCIFVIPAIIYGIYRYGYYRGIKSMSITSDKIVDNDLKKKGPVENPVIYAKKHKGGLAK